MAFVCEATEQECGRLKIDFVVNSNFGVVLFRRKNKKKKFKKKKKYDALLLKG